MQETLLRISFSDIVRSVFAGQPYLTHHRESYQVRANTESSALSGRYANRRGKDIKDGKHGGGGDRHREDLVHRQRLARDEKEGKGYGNTFYDILDEAGQQVIHVHSIYIHRKDFFWLPSKDNACCLFRNMSKEETEDYLTEDAELPSQKIVLLSFLSPEKVLANKDIFMFKKFLATYDVNMKTAKFEQWVAEQFRSANAKLEALAGSVETVTKEDLAKGIQEALFRPDLFVDSYKAYVKENLAEMSQRKLQEEYDDFLFAAGTKLEEEFFALNEFRSTMRGIKVRGVFATEAEASIRAKRLQKSDPSFNIYMGSVGKWMAWEPDPNKVGESEYANDELNNLMKKYRENEQSRDQFYTEQKNRRVQTGVVSDATSSDAVTSSASTSYDGLFSGPADLAMQRKAEVAAAAASSSSSAPAPALD